VCERELTPVPRMSQKDLMLLFGIVAEDDEGKPFIYADNADPAGGFKADQDHEGYANDA
jgi:hypothetical protein